MKRTDRGPARYEVGLHQPDSSDRDVSERAAALAAGVAVPGAAGMKGTGPRPGRRASALPSAPAFRRLAAEPREHVGRPGADRVAELLGMHLDDLGPLLEGRAGVGRAALERVRRARG